MEKRKSFSILFSLFVMICVVSCNGQVNSQNSTNIVNKRVPNCYILKPIQHNEEYKWIENIPPLDTNITSFLQKATFEKGIKVDTAIGYITNFECQKKILINSECFSKLSNPDSTDLANIYYYSRFNTSNRTGSNVEFVRSYEKKILNFGNSIVYEYHLRNVSRVESDFFHIIVFKQESPEIGEDFEGLVIGSNGLDWYEIKGKGEFIPIHLTNLRGGMQVKVPLYFNKFEFIPIGHFKGHW